MATMTIIEFAAKIGVSPTTVSRSLSGRGRVSPHTRQMIQERMQELGYTPNVHAQRLVAGRSFTVALDWGGQTQRSLLEDTYLAQLIEGIQSALQQHDVGLLLGGPHSTGILKRWVDGRAVDGVVVVSGDGNDGEAVAREIAGQGTPCVVLGAESLTGVAGVGSVTIDLTRGLQQAAAALVVAGHRRIGYLGTLLPDQALAPFRDALATFGLALADDRVVIAGRHPEDGARGLERLLEPPDPPTALFARNDIVAAGALRAARRRGVCVPGDLSLIGHDDLRFASLLEPALTTVRIDYARLGEMAVETLFYLLENPGRAASPQTLHTSLVLRDSLRGPSLA